jgi:hypothetical protein
MARLRIISEMSDDDRAEYASATARG